MRLYRRYIFLLLFVVDFLKVIILLSLHCIIDIPHRPKAIHLDFASLTNETACIRVCI